MSIIFLVYAITCIVRIDLTSQITFLFSLKFSFVVLSKTKMLVLLELYKCKMQTKLSELWWQNHINL